MKLSKLNMSLGNNSAKKGKKKEGPCCHVCATPPAFNPVGEFFPPTLLFGVTNVIQKIQGLSLPVFYTGAIWLPELFQLRRKKGGRDDYRE
jgi:hypothetical protein